MTSEIAHRCSPQGFLHAFREGIPKSSLLSRRDQSFLQRATDQMGVVRWYSQLDPVADAWWRVTAPLFVHTIPRAISGLFSKDRLKEPLQDPHDRSTRNLLRTQGAPLHQIRDQKDAIVIEVICRTGSLSQACRDGEGDQCLADIAGQARSKRGIGHVISDDASDVNALDWISFRLISPPFLRGRTWRRANLLRPVYAPGVVTFGEYHYYLGQSEWPTGLPLDFLEADGSRWPPTQFNLHDWDHLGSRPQDKELHHLANLLLGGVIKVFPDYDGLPSFEELLQNLVELNLHENAGELLNALKIAIRDNHFEEIENTRLLQLISEWKSAVESILKNYPEGSPHPTAWRARLFLDLLERVERES